jgi:hypothetical protein
LSAKLFPACSGQSRRRALAGKINRQLPSQTVRRSGYQNMFFRQSVRKLYFNSNFRLSLCPITYFWNILIR